MARIRLKDIAESCGCSVAVASHVINGSAGNVACRPELRARVLRVAAHAGYAPRGSVRPHRGGRAGAVGFCVWPVPGASISGAFESRLLAGAERAARERGADLLVLGGRDEEEAALACESRLASRRIDGLVLVRVPEDSSRMAAFAAADRNAVAIDWFGPAPVDAVDFDGRAATFLAVRELFRAGHRRIGYVGPLRAGAGGGAVRRLDGFLGAMAEHRLAVDPRWVFESAYPEAPPLGLSRRPPAEVVRWAARLYASAPSRTRPTAFASYSDLCALPFLAELRRLGIECPRDLSFVGLGDHPPCASVHPGLSTVRQPLEEMGAEAVRRLFERLDGSIRADAVARAVREAAASGPLETAAARHGVRGRPPAVVRSALDDEADEREARAAAARTRAAGPSRERWLRWFKPVFIPRESVLAPSA